MSPNRVFWFSFAVFGLTAAVSVGLDIAAGSVGIGTVAVLFGVLAIGYGSFVALTDPERANVPTTWGPLVYLAVAGTAVFLAGVGLQVYSVVA
ncbi:hypothetical protein [Haloferax sp. YSMS24]|uniref:hypothetical protein n=1 Tax=Haloferax sp. YSMS24 TaxID=3388425 RepID=UPI00398D5436